MRSLNIRLQSLSIFRALLADPVVSALSEYLESLGQDNVAQSVSRYAAFVSRLYDTEKRTLAGYIQSIVGNDENPYIHMIGKGSEPWPEMEANVWQELETLQQIADLTPEALTASLGAEIPFPKYAVKNLDLSASYRERCENIHRFGYGIYAKYHMFYLNPAGKIVPVQHPDETRLEQLIDYKREQQIIIDNTVALLEGKPAANILLTGDAGTGKSSTVKAIVNALYDQGLRVIEVRKDQLAVIPRVLDELASNPLKFILFIDDLSFRQDDDTFNGLKAVLEGSVSARSRNVVIYATSNRRHIIKERFSDREGDDVHRNDTMQELISLSERFGLHITFQKPDKKTYLHIVHHFAAEYGVEMADAELDMLAERFALERGGRSARLARQFIDSLRSK